MTAFAPIIDALVIDDADYLVSSIAREFPDTPIFDQLETAFADAWNEVLMNKDAGHRYLQSYWQAVTDEIAARQSAHEEVMPV